MENQNNVEDQNTQQIGRNPVNQPVVLPDKPKTKYLLIVGVVLTCFVVFGIGGYFLGMKRWSAKNSVSEANLPKPTSIPQASNTPNQDETINWKTYTNSDLNYSIKVPHQFGFDERGLPNLHISLITTSTPPAGLLDMYINIPSQCTTENQCLNSLITSYRGAQSAGSKAQFTQISTTITGKVVSGIEYWNPGMNDSGTVIPSSLIYEYFTKIDGKILDLQFVINSYQSIDEARTQKALVDQILSTFKITTPTTTNIEIQIGYIKSVYDKNSAKYLAIDYIQWLSQTAGTCRSESEGNSKIPACNPNGYLIINDNPQLRTFEISDNVVIDFSDFKNAGLGWKNDQQLSSSNLTLTEFQDIFLGNDSSIAWLKDAVYRVEINDNKITKIRYQYQP